MKIAAVLLILSVCYIAGTEQAAAPAGVHTYPSRPWKEMERKAQPEMEEFRMKTQNAEAAQIPYNNTDPDLIEEMLQCANMYCPGSEKYYFYIKYQYAHSCYTNTGRLFVQEYF